VNGRRIFVLAVAMLVAAAIHFHYSDLLGAGVALNPGEWAAMVIGGLTSLAIPVYVLLCGRHKED